MTKLQRISVKGIPVNIKEVSKAELSPLFGQAQVEEAPKGMKGTVLIREGLPPRVRSFIKKHEIQHVKDWKRNDGWLLSESRANFAAGIKEPIGFLYTTFLTLTLPKRRKYYFRKIFSLFFS